MKRTVIVILVVLIGALFAFWRSWDWGCAEQTAQADTYAEQVSDGDGEDVPPAPQPDARDESEGDEQEAKKRDSRIEAPPEDNIRPRPVEPADSPKTKVDASLPPPPPPPAGKSW